MERLILGPESIASITQAQEQLEALALREAQQRFQKRFEVYEPWMSHYQDRGILLTLIETQSSLVFPSRILFGGVRAC